MLTYELKKSPGVPLYEALYRCIRGDILSGALRPGEKLPSKRALAENLEVSKITVEAAYSQLLSEGYICSKEKVGYFVETVERRAPVPAAPVRRPKEDAACLLDLTANGTEQFPFSVWSRLQREVMLDFGEALLAPLPNRGVLPESLGSADVLHISPSHHFPTGIVTPVSRRRELLDWANRGEKWIIEDDYDSEFRFDAHPVPAMQSLDDGGRVIYMNSFSKSLAPSIRISYMVLPAGLMAAFQQKLGFYSCTVPSFEQYTLARFLSRGFFEKHINRMRKFYKNRRNAVVSLLEKCSFSDKLTIQEQDAGLHFLLNVDTSLSDQSLTEKLAALGIRVRALSSYYHDQSEDLHCLVINYSGLKEERLAAALAAISQEWT